MDNDGTKDVDDVKIEFYWSTDSSYSSGDKKADINWDNDEAIYVDVDSGERVSGEATINVGDISTSYDNLIMRAYHSESSDTDYETITVYVPKA